MAFDVQAWLCEQGVDAGLYDADVLVEAFIDEMDAGLTGAGSSLAMIPTYIGVSHAVSGGSSVAVIDAGGTNLRTCLAQFDEAGRISLSGFAKQPMLGTRGELSAKAFYGALADAVVPHLGEADVIGFCFSFPAEITPDRDGRLLHWTKEIQVPEVVGQCVGAGLLDELASRGITGKQVVVLNDTVAALLAGMAEGQAFGASSYVGFILGTGTNTAYVEQNGRIEKLSGLAVDGTQAINVESGAFSRFARGALDKKLDAESANPGKHIFEKVISGVYMGPLALALFKAAAAEGAFSEGGGATLAGMVGLSTIHIDNLVADDGRETGVLGTAAFCDADRDLMRVMFGAIVDRAALLTAVNITAAVVKSGAGRSADAPVCVNIDGSTYYKTYGMPEKVQAHLQKLLGARGLHIRCVHVDDAPVVGAAIAGLLV